MKKNLECLLCGTQLSPKERSDYCSKCLLGLSFELKEEDLKKIGEHLKSILDAFGSDIRAAFIKDPAAKSLVEVLTSYPGIHAVLLHRVAHFSHEVGLPLHPQIPITHSQTNNRDRNSPRSENREKLSHRPRLGHRNRRNRRNRRQRHNLPGRNPRRNQPLPPERDTPPWETTSWWAPEPKSLAQ